MQEISQRERASPGAAELETTKLAPVDNTDTISTVSSD
jgi:hypothetical protein